MSPGALFADLTQEEQDIFHNAFTKDLEDLKANEAIKPFFCDLFVTICKTPSISIFTDKEAQNILQLSDPHSKREAVLKYTDEKGPAALVVFYYLLHLKNKTAYENLPSCKENDQKMALISARDKSLTVLEKQIEEISQTLSKPPPPDKKTIPLVRDESLPSLEKQIEELLKTSSFKPPSPRPPKPIAPIAPTRPYIPSKNDETDDSVDAKENKLKEKDNEEKTYPANDTEERLEETDDEEIKLLADDTAEEMLEETEDEKKKPSGKVAVPHNKENWDRMCRNWDKNKNDVFFHFIILCFATGTGLVLNYKFSDWTVSAGSGLISFAVLEAIGIYFDFVNRVRRIIRAALGVIFQFFPRLGRNTPLSFNSKGREKLK